MQIRIAYPRVEGIRNGNQITADRWCGILASLGHVATISNGGDDPMAAPDLLIALHAVKSGPLIEDFRTRWPGSKIVVAVTGTDIYGSELLPVLMRSLALADRIVVLQEATQRDIPPAFGQKVRVIFQSLERCGDLQPPESIVPVQDLKGQRSRFEISVVGHLREVKDPFLTAIACQNLPEASQVRVTQIGASLSPAMETLALEYALTNDRYHWIGSLSRVQSLRRIALSDVLVNSSKIEGGAAVIVEAVVAGTPVLATHISGNRGLLGEDYCGFFEVGDWQQLRSLILQAENERDFYQHLKQQCHARESLFHPDFERESWAQLLAEFLP
jgi:putative glycosyltransferase (TIGR04348 family)